MGDAQSPAYTFLQYANTVTKSIDYRLTTHLAPDRVSSQTTALCNPQLPTDRQSPQRLG